MVRRKVKSLFIPIVCVAMICIGVTLAWMSFFTKSEKDVSIAVVDLNTTIDLVESGSISVGDVVANSISFSRKSTSKDFYVRARLYYDKDTTTTDELKYILVLNSQPISTYSGSADYKWAFNDADGYYYLVNNLDDKTPLSITSTNNSTITFASNVKFSGATSLYGTIAEPASLKAKATIEAIQSKNITGAGATLTISELTTYFADTFGFIAPKGFVVRYDSNGGANLPSEAITTNGATASLPTPTRFGYGFKGWYTDSTLTTAFTQSTVIAQNYTLYAKWEAN